MSFPGAFAFGGGGSGPPAFPGGLPALAFCFMAGVEEQFVTPTVAGASDLTNVAWSGSGASASDATTVLAIAGAGAHLIKQTPSDFSASVETTVECEVWAGTYQYGGVQLQTTTNLLAIDCSTGAIIYQGTDLTDVSVTDLGGVHYKLHFRTSTSTSGLTQLVATNAAGSTSWTAAGTETFHVTNILVTQAGSTSRLVFPNYKATDPTKGLIQFASQASFPLMPLRGQLSTGARALLGSAAAGYYLSGTLSSPLAQPFGLAFPIHFTAGKAAVQRLIGDAAGNGVYVDATDNLVMDAGTPVSMGALATGNHLLMLKFNGASSVAEVDGAVLGTGNPGANSLGSFNLLADSLGASAWDDLLQSATGYSGDWDADGRKGTLQSLLDAWAGKIF